MRELLRAFLFVLILTLGAPAARAGQAATAPKQGDPVLTVRPKPQPEGRVSPQGRIKLDVVVNDASGLPVTGLEPTDFTVLDDGNPRRILSFQRFDASKSRPDPPVEVLLVIDTINTPFQQLAVSRQQIGEFLRQDGGHLKVPVSIVLLTSKGARVQPRPSMDGNALLPILNGINSSIRPIISATGSDGQVERFQLTLKNLSLIVENEGRKPGRKLLLWIGGGWPILRRPGEGDTARSQKLNFDGIMALSRWLREGQVTMFSIGGGAEFYYRDYLKGVKRWEDADNPNLAAGVLAVESGGKTLDVGNGSDLARALNDCVAEAGAFYRISFDPPAGGRQDQYHEIKVRVNKPGLSARTNTGYYEQP